MNPTDQEKCDRLATDVMGWVLFTMSSGTLKGARFWSDNCNGRIAMADWNPLENPAQAIGCRKALLKKYPNMAFYLFEVSAVIATTKRDGAIKAEFYTTGSYEEYAAWADTDARATCEAIIAVLDTEKEAA